MMGNLGVIAEDPPAALEDPERGMLVGMGMAPEGTEQNPVLYELGADMFWRYEAPELGEWRGSYSRRRYGETTEEMSEAWEILERTVYSRPRDGGSHRHR
jgi:alpha-N-acetylglucosaminidase